MVVCAAGASVAAIQLLVGHTEIGSSGGHMQQESSCAIVDQLKRQLQLVIENGDETGAIDVIAKLEGLTLTKEILEATRIGLTVNEVRRQSAQKWPDLSKRCRSLIKCWQKIADFQQSVSSCGASSNGGTPSLISPGMRRGITPGGGGRRVTSTDSKSSLSRNGISPNTGYAPRKKPISPLDAATNNASSSSIHKSASVGAGMYVTSMNNAATNDGSGGSKHSSPEMLPVGADASNFMSVSGKRKADEALSCSLAVKRSKSVGTKLSQISPVLRANASSAASLSVVAARKDVQSTAELVAQLTENLPQNMTIDLKTEFDLANTNESATASSSSTGSPNGFVVSSAVNGSTTTQAKVKRKPSKRGIKRLPTDDVVEEEQATFNGQMTAKLRMSVIAEELPQPSDKKHPENGGDIMKGKEEDDLDEEEPLPKLTVSKKKDWLADLVPSLDALRRRMPEYARPYQDKTSSFVIPIRERRVLALPYVDLGGPDFLEYNYPDRERYVAGGVLPSGFSSFGSVQQPPQATNGGRTTLLNGNSNGGGTY